jgi:hypothetical protein
MRTDPAEILEAAADLYESEKIEWCKGSFFNNYTLAERHSNSVMSACAWGAIIHAATEDDRLSLQFAIGISVLDVHPIQDVRAAINRALEAVQHRLDRIPLPDFNDTVVESKQEIIDLFKDTAKELRNQS